MSAVLEAREQSARYLQAVEPPLVRQFDLLAGAPGGVARMRELILALAVHGKLVRQDRANEPAAVLIERIRVEKHRLVSAGAVKHDRPLPAIKDTDLSSDIPIGWQWIRLGEVVSISTGKLDANAATPDGVYPFFTCSNTPLKIDRYSFDCGAVLLAGNGDFNLKRYTGKFDAYQRTYVIEPCLLDLDFLFYTLRHNIDELTKNQRGSAIPYLKLADITHLLISLPPLAEQSRIVARVDELMLLCDALEARGRLETEQHARLLGTLLGTLTGSTTPEELAANWQRVAAHFGLLLDRAEAVDSLEQTILQLAVRGLLVRQESGDEPARSLVERIREEKARTLTETQLSREQQLPPITESEVPFDVLPDWEWVRLGEVTNFTNGFAFPSAEFNFDASGVGVVKIGDIQNGAISTGGMSYVSRKFASTIRPMFAVAPGDLLIAMSGATTGKLGFNESTESFLLNQRVGRIAPILMNRHFLCLCLQTKIAENLAISSGSAIPNLSTAQIRDIVIPLPPIAEQPRIVARVTELRRLCAALRQRLAAAQTTQTHLAEALVESATA